ncbi:MAG: beta-ketoacyl synthase N-terminal-like domain-containing protein, partial [Frankia sp.]
MRCEPIAVVGRACILPGAADPDHFWENIRAGRVSLSRVPEGRWRLPVDLAVDGAAVGGDRTWSDVGGYVDGFGQAFGHAFGHAFSRGGHGGAMGESAVRSALGTHRADGSLELPVDPLFAWTSHGAAAALRESGQEALRHRTGLVVGNLSFPSTGMADYAEQVWLAAQDAALCEELGIVPGRRPHAFNRFMSGLPAILAARELGLGLGGFGIDAACASGLYAVKLACDRLHDRSADVMLAGGVSRADDLFIHISFCSLTAMSRSGRSRPFHRDADGLVPAEGAAFFALMRLADAIAADVEIFGVIRGVGLSNDGRGGGSLAPSEDGQVRAMRAAYAAAGVPPESVGLLECHATGTALGDATEVRSTSRIFSAARGLPIGSVKSNIGHLTTAAGAAGLMKILGALRTGIRPATLGVDDPLPELSASPLRLLTDSEDWPGPRRAAVSAFGFGGNKAHLVIDAWTGDGGTPAVPSSTRPGSPVVRLEGNTALDPVPPTGSAAPAPVDPVVVDPVVVVAIGAKVADGQDTHDLCRALMAGNGRAARRGNVEVALDGLCYPPVDLTQAQPQQLLVLQAAREAASTVRLPKDRTMVLIGMGCDPEVARYVARWRVPGWLPVDAGKTDPGLVDMIRDAVRPAQTAAGVLGAMPNIVANRINAQLDLTGPGFTVSAEEASGVVALEIALRALRAGEVDAALVGAVDLVDQAVHRAALADLGISCTPGDAAVVLVLKRLADARADQDEIIAVLDDDSVHGGPLDGGSEVAGSLQPPTPRAPLTVGDIDGVASVGEQFDPSAQFGRPHAASGLLSVAVAALAVRHRATPRAGRPAVPALGSRSAEVVVRPLAGPVTRMRLHPGEPAAFLAEAAPALHVYSGGSRAEVVAALAAGRESADGPARLVVLSVDAARHAAQVQAASRWLQAGGRRPAGVVFRERPVVGEVVFVFSGGSMAYPGMGRELMLAFPTLLDEVQARCGPLDQLTGWAYAPDARPRHALDQVWGAAVLGQVHAGLTRSLLGIRPRASIGYSSGELTALAALGAWPDVAPLTAKGAEADLFAGVAADELEVVRRAWRRLGIAGTAWVSHLIDGPVERVRAALADEPAVHLMVVNAPDSCVIGGESGGCGRVLRRLDGLPTLAVSYDIPAHVPELGDTYEEWLRTYRLPTASIPDVRFYTCSTGSWYHPSTDEAAAAVTRQQLGPIDFAGTVEQAWTDGGRIFIEHGPRTLCSAWIRRTLGAREHLAVALDSVDGRDVEALLRAVAELVAAGVPADTAALNRYLAEAWPARRPAGRELVLPAHPPEFRLPDRRPPHPSTATSDDTPATPGAPAADAAADPAWAEVRGAEVTGAEVMQPAPAFSLALDLAPERDPAPRAVPAPASSRSLTSAVRTGAGIAGGGPRRGGARAPAPPPAAPGGGGGGPPPA